MYTNIFEIQMNLLSIQKIKKRQMENEMEKKKEASFINIKATRIGQALFRELKKT